MHSPFSPFCWQFSFLLLDTLLVSVTNAICCCPIKHASDHTHRIHHHTSELAIGQLGCRWVVCWSRRVPFNLTNTWAHAQLVVAETTTKDHFHSLDSARKWIACYLSSIVGVRGNDFVRSLGFFHPSHRCRSTPSTVGYRSATCVPPSISMHFETVTKPTSFTCFCPSCTLT